MIHEMILRAGQAANFAKKVRLGRTLRAYIAKTGRACHVTNPWTETANNSHD